MKYALRVSAQVENLAVIRRFVVETATSLGADRESVEDVLQAVDEAATNIILHGYRGQPGEIEIEMDQDHGALVVCLRDRAFLFDPTRVPLPDLTLPLEARPVGGLGVYLIRQFTDQMTWRATPEGNNELTLRKQANIKSEEAR